MTPDVVVLSRAGEASLPRPSVKALRVRYAVRFVVQHDRPSGPRAAALLSGARVLAATNVALPVLDDALLDRLPDLRHVVLYATGYEHLDIAGLDRRGITVSTLPDYATNAVAEHALALLFASAARVHLSNDKSVGRAPQDVSLRGVEITNRTLAIIGLGRTGRRLGALARGLGMRVIGADIDPGARVSARRAGIPTLTLAECLHQADLVAVTASTIAGQYPILDTTALARLHPDVFVVNVGRPALVDGAAMRTALLAHHIRGYAVDEVILDPADPLDALLIAQGRVLQSAHSAWWRDEALANGAQMFATAIQAAADGAPIHVVPSAPALTRAAG